jgi:hypothetical protein
VLERVTELIEKHTKRGVDSDRPKLFALPQGFLRWRRADVDARSPENKPHGSSLMQKLSWAAAEQELAERLIGSLQTLNDGLRVISGEAGHLGYHEDPLRILTHVLDGVDLQELAAATAQHDPDFARCADFKREVTQLLKSNSGEISQVAGRSPLQLLPLQVKGRKETQATSMSTAEFKIKGQGTATKVLLEDKSYADSQASDYEKFVEGRVNEIAAILAKTPKPAKMCVLDCIGYVPNRGDKRFSLVYKYPSDADASSEPISLRRLLAPGCRGWSARQPGADSGSRAINKPGLQTRFEMAVTLSRSLGMLQACGVLHKGLTSDCILFFRTQIPHEAGSAAIDMARPYISGFSWARLHGSEYISDKKPSKDFASTSGLLQVHPQYSFNRDQRYQKVFDVYSLGLLLLQIGLWCQLPEVADKLFPSPKSCVDSIGSMVDEILLKPQVNASIKESLETWKAQLHKGQQKLAQSDGISQVANPRRSFQEALVGKLEDLLLADVGPIYTRVVARCLTGDIENQGLARDVVTRASDEGQPESLLQDEIIKNIVQELERCHV